VVPCRVAASTVDGSALVELIHRGPIEDLLREVDAELRLIADGQLATYIPELANADPGSFGLSLTTVDGHRYSAGDAEALFTIQSVSKPFAYALALADRGLDDVTRRVGVEPTGDPFNSITVDERTARPFNPMVNAGAIVTTSLVAGEGPGEQFERIRSGLSAFAGRQLGVDERVYESERATGDRNRAIAFLMRTVGALSTDVDDVLDVYFRQCAIEVTAGDLSVMAATLANGGINPLTGQAAMRREHVERVLTVMATCGMYDYAGEWLFRVGLPAKSGVSGGIVAVLPGQLGLGLYGPLLDERGNSVRGIAACEELSNRLGLHVLRPNGSPPSTVRRTYRADVVRSKRARTRDQLDVLDAVGSSVIVYEIQGDQGFTSAEALIRAVRSDLDQVTSVVLDVRRVSRVDNAAVVLLEGLVGLLADRGVELVIADPHGLARTSDLGDQTRLARRFLDVESALEWCENGALGRAGFTLDELPDRLVTLSEQELAASMDAESVAVLESLVTTRVQTAGVVIFDEGDEADCLYFVAAGQVSVDIRVGPGRRRSRLTSIGPGRAFGELSLVDGGTRSSRVVADEPTLCHVLTRDALDEMRREHPEVAIELYRAIARSLSVTLRRATGEIRSLER
jgi:glutaminase